MKKLLITNVLTIILLLFIIIKEDYHKRFWAKLVTSIDTKLLSKEDLLVMNNTIKPEYIEYEKGNSNKLFKVIIVGNSLAHHEILKDIGWTHGSGMAATSIDKDYAHLLLKKLSKKLPNTKIVMRVSNFADFERNPKSLAPNITNNLVNFNPDLVIFQIGENTEEQNFIEFKEKYIELINCFKKNQNPITICTTSFFPHLEKNNITEKVALETNSFLVDLSHLPLLDIENYARNEKKYPGDKSKWKVIGIGMHPGDRGMENIANALFTTVNGIIEQQNKL